ncbi:VOC family protein [Pseudaestuariivita sp.]|uniref:VOC family protein n=1 Tax=Pseudaestuariivita sp. TaxID=2211669 RepID=UPI0040597B3F
MKLHPYLTFDGNAREALDYYAATFGTEVRDVMTFGDIPGDEPWVDETNKHRIANASVDLAGVTVMASDTAGFESFNGHHGIVLNIGMEDLDAGKALFEKLSDGGSVEMPFEATFWARGFGVCRDKFGVGWMVNVE